jgi:NADPH:quinone reductase-like Zn-dependent oxidoreductase
MKAVELRNQFGIDSLELVERPEPRPGPRQVVVKMQAWSLNYRDLMVVKGIYNPRLRLPIVSLSDGAGHVAAVGDGVTRVKVGDRVASVFVQDWVSGPLTDARLKSALGAGGTGVLAEYVLVDQEGVVPVPDHLTDEEAATLPCAALTAWHALITEGHVKPGDVVLTQGTGGVSIFALQFARMAGARIIITSSRDDKLERARGLGAAEGINYRTIPDWDKRARELTGDAGADHLIELGGVGTLPRSLRAVRPGGTISLIGVLTGNAGEVNPTSLIMRNVRLQGIFVGSREMFEAMNRAIVLHKLRPVIDRVFSFTEVHQAFRHMESASHFGKICIRM